MNAPVLLQIVCTKSHILRGSPPSPATIPFTWSREQQPSLEILDDTSVLLSVAWLLYPFEIQCKSINSTWLLVAACMVCILSIRKNTKSSPFVHISQQRCPVCPCKYWKLLTWPCRPQRDGSIWQNSYVNRLLFLIRTLS